MVNVAADIDEVRDIILALTFSHFIGQKRIRGCTLYHSSQTQHRCLYPVDEETTGIRIDQCWANWTGELLRMVCTCNN